MKVAIMQPHFLPFYGYFKLIKHVDLFLFYDSAQFNKRSWQSRTYISNGNSRFLWSLPVVSTGGSRKPIRETNVLLSAQKANQSVKRLRHFYGSNCEAIDLVISMLDAGQFNLAEWNIQAILVLSDILNIKTDTRRASEFEITAPTAVEKLIELCEAVQATTYVATIGAKGYLNEGKFSEKGISVEWLEYKSAQALQNEQKPYPSIIDHICSHGLDSAMQLVDGC